MRALLANPKIQQLVRFVIVGTTGTGLYIGIAFGILEVGAPTHIAHITAYVGSMLFSYLAQKVITFRVRGDHRRMGPRFVLAVAAISVTQYALVYVMQAMGSAERVTILASAAFYPLASFIVHTTWTFRQKGLPNASGR